MGNIMSEKRYIIDGFDFGSIAEAELAKNELNGIKYLKERTDFKNAKNVLNVYNRVVDKQLFKTPIGYKFLKEMQDILYQSSEIKDDEIVAIPVLSEKKGKTKEKRSKKTKPLILSKEDVKFKNRFTNSVIINILLIVLLVIFIIISSNSNNTNILNYENRLNREYIEKENDLAKWQQELTDKEKDLRLLEEKLSGE